MLVVAAAAVIVSWMVPESPESEAPALEPIVPVANTGCSTDYSGPPSYGTRSLSNRCAH